MAKLVFEIEEIKEIIRAHAESTNNFDADADDCYFEVDTAEEKDIADIEHVRFVLTKE